MRLIISVAIIFLSFTAFAQHEVTGMVKEINGEIIPGAQIHELNTENRTTTDTEGKFSIITTQNSCTLSISFIGYRTKIVTIIQDTTIPVLLEPDRSQSSRWFTLGTNYDVFHAVAGLVVSNGYDEHPLIHFEDFSESWLYKVNGTTDFRKDYAFGIKIAHDYAFRYVYMPAVEFRQINYDSGRLRYTDINLSLGAPLKLLPGDVLLKTGYQHLNGYNALGAGIGWQKSQRNPNAYYGFVIGYWTHYWTYNAFIQGISYKYMLNLRVNYERIARFNFLTIGIHHTFNR